MDQVTLLGETIKPREPFSHLSPNERKIWNLLNSMGRGMTHDHIRRVMESSGISTFDNRLRDLRQKGWVESYRDQASGLLLFFAVKPEVSAK